jgi:hypothetical protein
MSALFLRTLRDDPADAEVDSHRLLVRAGYIRRVSSGIYSWLPLGNRVLRKVSEIVRQEMDAAAGKCRRPSRSPSSSDGGRNAATATSVPPPRPPRHAVLLVTDGRGGRDHAGRTGVRPTATYR